jgi:hypothetical protein
MTIKRPLQIIEIDLDLCSRVFGSSPCTAALSADVPNKCWNTRATCADPANYATGTPLALRFAMPQDGLPKGELIFPSLESPAAGTSTEINLGGVDQRTGALGRRETGSITLRDFTFHERGVDPYAAERVSGAAQNSGVGYDPAARSTFLRKTRRRNRYYEGRALRVLDGYVGEALAAMDRRHFIITEWIENTDGTHTIKYADPLWRANADNAKAPTATAGRLAADIDAGYLGAVAINPPSIGSDYAASGRVCIGSEIMTYTRSGDVLTITARGVDGTDAAGHSADDGVQDCLRYEATPIAEVIEDLLTTYAGVDGSFIDTAAWAAEAGRWLAGFDLTVTIPKPEDVSALLAELTQLGVFVWWDGAGQEVRLRANRPIDTPEGETAAAVSDEADVLEGTLGIADMVKQRLSSVILYHGIVDPTSSATRGENYLRPQVVLDQDAGGADQYGSEKTHTIYSRWLGPAGNDAIASAVAGRYLARFRDPPRAVTWRADIAGKAKYPVAGLVDMTSRVLVDDDGAELATTLQILASREVEPGAVIEVKGQTFEFAGRFGYITENGRPDYGASSAAEKASGTYIVDGSTLTFADGSGPYVIF